jgi:hypothetical protein
MTLCVDTYIYDENGEMKYLQAESGKDLAGFESYRNTFYGSDFVKSLNLKKLYSLREGDLWAEGKELNELETEVKTFMKNLDKFVRRIEDKLHFEFRLQNILDAIKKAKEIGGGVVVQ